MAYYTRRRSVPARRGSRWPYGLRGFAGLGQDDGSVPAGSSFSYFATWGTGALLQDYTSVANALRLPLATQNIIIDGFSGVPWYKSGYGISLNVHTTGGFAKQADIQSIIDGFLYNLGISGGKVTSQLIPAALASVQPAPSASPVDLGPTSSVIPTPPPGGQPQGFGDWVAANWLWLAGAAVGVFAVREIL